MSERTAQNIKGEKKMALIGALVIGMLSVPIALSIFRDVAPIVGFLLKATPFVLMASAIFGMVYMSKTDK